METQVSNKTAFDLINNFLLGIQSKDIDRILAQFHQNLEYRRFPIDTPIGIEAFKDKMQDLILHLESYSFELSQVVWDAELSVGIAIMDYEMLVKYGGEKESVVAMFKIEDKLVSYFSKIFAHGSIWHVN